MDDQFERLENTTTVIVNDRQVEFSGVGNANEGRLTAKIEHSFPFAVELLAPMLIVGYPTYSEYRGTAEDLFKPSTLEGGYKYQRSYRFSNGQEFTSFHNIDYDLDDNHLRGMFATRDFPEDAFPGEWRIQDLVETFIPHAPGMMKSVMATGWRDGDQTLYAQIESEYYLNHNRMLPRLHWRHVKFQTEHRDSLYFQTEKITVLDDLDFGAPINQFVSK